MMIDHEIEGLLVCAQSNEPWTTVVYNASNSAPIWSLRGTEMKQNNNALPHQATLIGNEFVVMSLQQSPVLHVYAFRKKNLAHRRWILPGAAQHLAVSACGKVLCAAISNNIYTWLLSSGDLVSITRAHYQPINKLAFTDDSSFLVTAGQDGQIQAWNVTCLLTNQQKKQQLIESTDMQSGCPYRKWLAHAVAVTDLWVTAGGSSARIVSCSLDHSCKLHSLSSGELLLTVVFDVALQCVTMDSAECRLFVGTASGLICQTNLYQQPVVRERHVNLIAAADYSESQTFKGHSASVQCISVNFDGCTLASGSDDHSIRIWNIDSHQCMRSITCKGPIGCCQFLLIPSALRSDKANHAVRIDNACLAASLQKKLTEKLEKVKIFLGESQRMLDSMSPELKESWKILESEEANCSLQQKAGTSSRNKRPTYEQLAAELELAKSVNRNLYQFAARNCLTDRQKWI